MKKYVKRKTRPVIDPEIEELFFEDKSINKKAFKLMRLLNSR
jgi:hypothetical protein